MDANTATAVAAVAVAVVAIALSTAQVLQQYFSTGQVTRICDSVVFGNLPGQGRRIWQKSQFRFRVVYALPQLSLPEICWELPNSCFQGGAWVRPSSCLHQILKPACAKNADHEESGPSSNGQAGNVDVFLDCSNLEKNLVERNRSRTTKGFPIGEASWASFARAIDKDCGLDCEYNIVLYDADRCPPDLPTAPMPVSMRDVAMMALTTGMVCTSASFVEKRLFMQGQIGSITSSLHPALGPLLHFSPSPRMQVSTTWSDVRFCLSPAWLCRTWDIVTVASRSHNHRDRRNLQKITGQWISRFHSSNKPLQGALGFSETQAQPKQREIYEHRIQADKHLFGQHVNGLYEKSTKVLMPQRGPNDGNWTLELDKNLYRSQQPGEENKQGHSNRKTDKATSSTADVETGPGIFAQAKEGRLNQRRTEELLLESLPQSWRQA